jgi:hypothetical protein
MIAAVIFAAVSQEAQAQQLVPPKNAIVGAWVETITISGPGAPPPFKSVGIYAENGTLMFSDQGGVTTNPPQVFSSAAGSWIYVKDRTFAWTVVGLISDLDGSLAGTLKVKGESTLDASGNNYSSVWHVEISDANGQLLFAADGTNVGQRIAVERLP